MQMATALSASNFHHDVTLTIVKSMSRLTPFNGFVNGGVSDDLKAWVVMDYMRSNPASRSKIRWYDFQHQSGRAKVSKNSTKLDKSDNETIKFLGIARVIDSLTRKLVTYEDALCNNKGAKKTKYERNRGARNSKPSRTLLKKKKDIFELLQGDGVGKKASVYPEGFLEVYGKKKNELNAEMAYSPHGVKWAHLWPRKMMSAEQLLPNLAIKTREESQGLLIDFMSCPTAVEITIRSCELEEEALALELVSEGAFDERVLAVAIEQRLFSVIEKIFERKEGLQQLLNSKCWVPTEADSLYYVYLSASVVSLTALARATKNGLIDVVKNLLDEGANPNGQAERRDEESSEASQRFLSDLTPVAWACIRGDSNVVKLLLDSGADARVITRRDAKVEFEISAGREIMFLTTLALDLCWARKRQLGNDRVQQIFSIEAEMSCQPQNWSSSLKKKDQADIEHSDEGRQRGSSVGNFFSMLQSPSKSEVAASKEVEAAAKRLEALQGKYNSDRKRIPGTDGMAWYWQPKDSFETLETCIFPTTYIDGNSCGEKIVFAFPAKSSKFQCDYKGCASMILEKEDLSSVDGGDIASHAFLSTWMTFGAKLSAFNFLTSMCSTLKNRGITFDYKTMMNSRGDFVSQALQTCIAFGEYDVVRGIRSIGAPISDSVLDDAIVSGKVALSKALMDCSHSDLILTKALRHWLGHLADFLIHHTMACEGIENSRWIKIELEGEADFVTEQERREALATSIELNQNKVAMELLDFEADKQAGEGRLFWPNRVDDALRLSKDVIADSGLCMNIFQRCAKAGNFELLKEVFEKYGDSQSCNFDCTETSIVTTVGSGGGLGGILKSKAASCDPITPLGYACMRGDTEMAKFLIMQGANMCKGMKIPGSGTYFPMIGASSAGAKFVLTQRLPYYHTKTRSKYDSNNSHTVDKKRPTSGGGLKDWERERRLVEGSQWSPLVTKAGRDLMAICVQANRQNPESALKKLQSRLSTEIAAIADGKLAGGSNSIIIRPDGRGMRLYARLQFLSTVCRESLELDAKLRSSKGRRNKKQVVKEQKRKLYRTILYVMTCISDLYFGGNVNCTEGETTNFEVSPMCENDRGWICRVGGDGTIIDLGFKRDCGKPNDYEALCEWMINRDPSCLLGIDVPESRSLAFANIAKMGKWELMMTALESGTSQPDGVAKVCSESLACAAMAGKEAILSKLLELFIPSEADLVAAIEAKSHDMVSLMAIPLGIKKEGTIKTLYSACRVGEVDLFHLASSCVRLDDVTNEQKERLLVEAGKGGSVKILEDLMQGHKFQPKLDEGGGFLGSVGAVFNQGAQEKAAMRELEKQKRQVFPWSKNIILRSLDYAARSMHQDFCIKLLEVAVLRKDECKAPYFDMKLADFDHEVLSSADWQRLWKENLLPEHLGSPEEWFESFCVRVGNANDAKVETEALRVVGKFLRTVDPNWIQEHPECSWGNAIFDLDNIGVMKIAVTLAECGCYKTIEWMVKKCGIEVLDNYCDKDTHLVALNSAVISGQQMCALKLFRDLGARSLLFNEGSICGVGEVEKELKIHFKIFDVEYAFGDQSVEYKMLLWHDQGFSDAIKANRNYQDFQAPHILINFLRWKKVQEDESFKSITWNVKEMPLWLIACGGFTVLDRCNLYFSLYQYASKIHNLGIDELRVMAQRLLDTEWNLSKAIVGFEGSRVGDIEDHHVEGYYNLTEAFPPLIDSFSICLSDFATLEGSAWATLLPPLMVLERPVFMPIFPRNLFQISRFSSLPRTYSISTSAAKSSKTSSGFTFPEFLLKYETSSRQSVGLN
tara:strand:- start:1349 stop:6757 length:5409 start_codon:yes stop_codon:yes gene_type:complete